MRTQFNHKFNFNFILKAVFTLMIVFTVSPVFAELKTAVWNGGAGDWDVPANWDINEVPCNTGVTTYDVEISSGAPNFNVVQCTIEQLTLSSASINGTKNLTINGLFTWEGGASTISPNIDAMGGIEISGGPYKSINQTINNHGVANLRGGDLTLNIGGPYNGIFNNHSTGVFNIVDSAVSFQNGGNFNNMGEFNLNKAGDFEIYSQLNNSNRVNIPANSRLILRHQGAQSGSFEGEGELYFYSQGGAINQTFSGTPTFTVPSLRLNRVNFVGSTTLDYNGLLTLEDFSSIGVDIFNTHGSVEVVGSGYKSFKQTFNNYGTFNFRGGDLYLNLGGPDNGTINNQNTGVFNIIDNAISFQAVGNFNNMGEFNLNKPGDFEVYSELNNANQVNISANSRLMLRNEGVHSGNFNGAGELYLKNANANQVVHALTGTPNFNVLNFRMERAKIQGPVTIDFDGTLFMELSSAIGVDTFNAHGVVELISYGDKSITRTFNNYGVVNFRDGNFRMTAGGSDYGIFNNQNTGVFKILENAAYMGNNGHEGEFNNNGRVEIQKPTILTSVPYSQMGGETVLNGGVWTSGRNLNILGGILSGYGTINFASHLYNDVIVGGRLSAGSSIGTLIIDGKLKFLESGELFVELQGMNGGSLFDFIHVTGNVEFAGNLFGTIIANPNLIAESEDLTVLQAGSITQQFGNIPNGGTLYTLNGAETFKINYGDDPSNPFDHNKLVFSDFQNQNGVLPADLTLISSDISFTPNNPSTNNIFSINANIKNNGETQASDFDVKFYVYKSTVVNNFEFIGQQTILQLLPGQNTQVSVQTSFEDEAYYLIKVIVDEVNQIVETKETNNQASQVLQVGSPSFTNAEIYLQSSDISTCRGSSAGVGGTAYYDFNSLPGLQDFPVQGAAVTVKIFNSLQQIIDTFAGTLTDVGGNVRQGIIAPQGDGTYTLRIKVFDGTISKEIDKNLIVNGPCIEVPPTPPCEHDCGFPPPSQEDILTSSDGISFSKDNPQLGEQIKIYGNIFYFGQTPRFNIPVVINDLFPVAGQLQTFQIGGTNVDFPNAQNDSPLTMSVSWRNTAYGAHVIQLVADPNFSQPTGNDQATRLIVIGTSSLSLDKRAELLIDADNNQFISPGDTLRYFVDYFNVSSAQVMDAKIIDKFDENFLMTPYNISHSGSIVNGDIVWDIGTVLPGLPPQGFANVSYDVQIKPLSEKTFINNFAFMTANDAQGNRVPSAADTHQVEVKINRAPVADAGDNKFLNQTGLVQLDGGGSYDPDGNSFTFAWTLTNKPLTSQAILNNSSSSTPTFEADVAGNYEIQLIVTDQYGLDSQPDSVVVDFNNLPPTADAGEVQTVHPGVEVILDGSGSNDPDNNIPLTYFWELNEPVGSNAILSDPHAVNPSFTVDLLGEYIVTLIVKDALGAESAVDEVIISTSNSAPIADAGADQFIQIIGSVVHLDGSHSYDPDGDTISYSWMMTDKPLASFAVLNNPSVDKPTFTADIHGDYRIKLIVTDAFGVPSDADEILISFDNVHPVAEAGVNKIVVVGDIVTLNGSGSSDANFDTLTYSWGFASTPLGSSAIFNDPTSTMPQFVADKPGDYIISLVVHDGFASSDPDNVSIKAIILPTTITNKIGQLINLINSFPNNFFKNANMKNTLTGNGKLGNVLKKIGEGNYQAALDKINDDLLPKVDGCSVSATHTVDADDWIISCDAQMAVYECLIEIREWLLSLI